MQPEIAQSPIVWPIVKWFPEKIVIPELFSRVYEHSYSHKPPSVKDQEDKEMDVIEVDDELALKTCKMHSYKYAVITPDDIVIPPKPKKW